MVAGKEEGLGMGKLYYCTVTTQIIGLPAESGINLEL